jgi:multiple sugar transport system permease protein
MTDIATRANRVVPAIGGRRRHNGGGPRAGTIAAFLIPFFLPFVLFYLVPVAYAIWQSFLVVRRTGGQYGTSYTTFGGFEQYVQVFQNNEFWRCSSTLPC